MYFIQVKNGRPIFRHSRTLKLEWVIVFVDVFKASASKRAKQKVSGQSLYIENSNLFSATVETIRTEIKIDFFSIFFFRVIIDEYVSEHIS